MSAHAEDSAYALLADGTTVQIRPARPEDFAAVRDLHAKLSPDNLYLRFFSLSPLAAEREARRICRKPGPDHAALLAVLDGKVVGCGTHERLGVGSQSAEVAFSSHAPGLLKRLIHARGRPGIPDGRQALADPGCSPESEGPGRAGSWRPRDRRGGPGRPGGNGYGAPLCAHASCCIMGKVRAVSGRQI